MVDNFNDNEKEHLRQDDSKRKKKKHINLDSYEKEQLGKCEKKKRSSCVITLMMMQKKK